jgi:L-ascorbate metabolism protein UlaG (beta-lactamase superfamily)
MLAHVLVGRPGSCEEIAHATLCSSPHRKVPTSTVRCCRWMAAGWRDTSANFDDTMSPLSLQQVRAHATPSGNATLWWLGQAGFIIKSPGGIVIALDPYLSNSCQAIGVKGGFDMDRLVHPPLAPEELADLDDIGWHELLAEAMAPHQPDVLVAVINPAFRNLSPAEAALLARRLNLKTVIPCHHDLFKDNCQPPQMLHTNLKLHGMGQRYRLLRHGVAFDFNSTSSSI